MLKKVFNWSEVHLSEITYYKFHTLEFTLLKGVQKNFSISMLGHQCKIDSDSPSTTNCSTVVLKDLKHSFSDLGHNFLAFASYSEKRRVGRPLSEAAGNEAHKLGNDDPFLYYSLFLISFRTVLSVHS